MKLILASQSPRRKQILSRLNISFGVIVSDVDESIFSTDGTPADHAMELASIKCEEVSRNYTDYLVVGADTIVILDGNIMGKPEDKQDAILMLETLSGNTHEVITAISIQYVQKNIIHTFFESTNVTFRQIPESHILTYVDSESPYDKAGSYGIQDWSAIFVEKINGCYDNVVGFPLSRFVFELKKIGINLNEIS
ncbi:MAG: septum formation inhibitor Maf [Candidatus Marinimicrobia bacterium]|jgi:septum formation protein|nr:septum formation inhibitor Maf [Candidatus Neomarinimicrobiota bacterium]MBT6870533.1 septum formation inhibitor Maf [Candidatus Neomarinimicrobiota bacterium]MBT7377795.1 septum formation inhibitor Maf [Candidatus Neomarinimicrobiota bacterium]